MNVWSRPKIPVVLAVILICGVDICCSRSDSQSYRALGQGHPDVQGQRAYPAGRGESPAPARHARARQCLSIFARFGCRLRPLCPLVALSEAGCCRVGATCKREKHSWDFSAIDPMTIDFLQATNGHSIVLNFSTIPQWMYKTDKPITYPIDPNQVTWDL